MEFPEHELSAMLQEIVEAGHVTEGSREHVIARMAIARGYAALSEAQKAIYQMHVLPYVQAIAHKYDREDRVSRGSN